MSKIVASEPVAVSHVSIECVMPARMIELTMRQAIVTAQAIVHAIVTAQPIVTKRMLEMMAAQCPGVPRVKRIQAARAKMADPAVPAEMHPATANTGRAKMGTTPAKMTAATSKVASASAAAASATPAMGRRC